LSYTRKRQRRRVLNSHREASPYSSHAYPIDTGCSFWHNLTHIEQFRVCAENRDSDGVTDRAKLL